MFALQSYSSVHGDLNLGLSCDLHPAFTVVSMWIYCEDMSSLALCLHLVLSGFHVVCIIVQNCETGIAYLGSEKSAVRYHQIDIFFSWPDFFCSQMWSSRMDFLYVLPTLMVVWSQCEPDNLQMSPSGSEHLVCQTSCFVQPKVQKIYSVYSKLWQWKNRKSSHFRIWNQRICTIFLLLLLEKLLKWLIIE